MKLNSAQVERTLSQLQGEAIPNNHSVVPQLNNIFGEHRACHSMASGVAFLADVRPIRK